MAKFISKLLFSLFLIFSGLHLNAQWLSDTRLTHDSVISITAENNARGIAVKGDTVIIPHQTKLYGYWHVYARLSFNSGATWEDSTKLAGSSLSDYYHPSIVSDKRGFYIVYVHQLSDDKTLVSFRASTNGGESFSTGGVGGMDAIIKSHPVIAVDSNIIHVVFSFNVANSNQAIKYYRSTNFGNTFDEVMTWSSAAGHYDYPSISYFGTNIFLAFSFTTGGNSDILFVRSTDKGFNWSAVQQLTDDPSVQAYPSLASSGNNVYIAWEDNRYGNYDILSCKSTNGGTSWFNEVRLTSHSSEQRKPNITANGTNIHVVWQDSRDSAEIYYLSSTNYGSSWQSVQKITFNPGTSIMPSIAANRSLLYVTWTDNRFSHNEVFFKKNPTGNAIGIQSINNEVPSGYMLSQNYPNPFNPSAEINFSVPVQSFVKLAVYDILGREIAILVNENIGPGNYKTKWNAEKYTSGVYFYKLQTEGYRETKKMILIK